MDSLIIVSIIISAIALIVATIAITKKPKLEVVDIQCDKGIHFYEHIFDTKVGEPTINSAKGVFADEMIDVMNASKSRSSTYKYSVCRYCGKVVNKNG